MPSGMGRQEQDDFGEVRSFSIASLPRLRSFEQIITLLIIKSEPDGIILTNNSPYLHITNPLRCYLGEIQCGHKRNPTNNVADECR